MNDDDAPDDDPCPICHKPSVEDVCEHHLASFDLTFSDEGEYGIGLGGGELYDVSEIGALFDLVALVHAREALADGSPGLSVAQIVDLEPALTDYAECIQAAGVDPAKCTSAEDLAHDVMVSTVGRAETIRGAITVLLSGMDIGVLSTECTVESGPGGTSEIRELVVPGSGRGGEGASGAPRRGGGAGHGRVGREGGRQTHNAGAGRE